MQAPGKAAVVRAQTLDYRDDGLLTTSSFDGSPTSYTYTPGGYLSSVTDWRANPDTVSYDSFPSGNPQRITFGDEATASFTYHDDGAVRSLDYDVPTLGSIRSHSNMTYDHRGLLTSEQVSVATVTPGADTGGTAGFSYDLAGRLKSWTSPFRLVSSMPTTDNPVTTYSLDDASNITSEQVTVGSEVRRSTTASFVNARLETHATDTSDVAAAGTDTATDTTFDYLPIGDESRRDSTTTTTSLTGGSTFSHSRASSYDAAGRPDAIDNSGTAPPPDVDYLYDVSGRLLARTSGSDTRYFFYFATGSRYAQETDPSGTVITRYLNAPRGGVLAEQRVGSGAWVWLLKDPQSNVATELRQGQVAPQVIGHRAYDPYGATYDGGTQTAVGEQASKLGYQSARRDEDTGYLLIGPRLYDPDTDRFTSADFYVGAASDMSLGTDPLTGNRYLFAAANPVAFDDDGHAPIDCSCAGRAGSRSSTPGSGDGGLPTPMEWVRALVGNSLEAGRASRRTVSGLALAWRWHPDPEVRSLAARTIGPAGRWTKPFVSIASRAGAFALLGLDYGLTLGDYDGQPRFEAHTRTILEVGGGAGSAAGIGAGCAAGVASGFFTAGISTVLLCGGLAVGGSVAGAHVGRFVGHVLFTDTPNRVMDVPPEGQTYEEYYSDDVAH